MYTAKSFWNVTRRTQNRFYIYFKPKDFYSIAKKCWIIKYILNKITLDCQPREYLHLVLLIFYRWLVSIGNVDKAVEVLRSFEKVNKLKIPDNVMDEFVVSVVKMHSYLIMLRFLEDLRVYISELKKIMKINTLKSNKYIRVYFIYFLLLRSFFNLI